MGVTDDIAVFLSGAGDIPGARADWIQVLVRAPEGPAADVVRNRIELLEVPEDRK